LNIIDKLKHYDAKLEVPFDQMIDNECKPFIENLINFSKNLLKLTNKFVDDSDYKSNEILINIGNFYLDIAKKLDDFKKARAKLETDYEIEKAKVAD